MSLSLAALLVAFVLLALARTLRSNLHSTHRNLVGALFLSQLVFLVGIARTGNPVSPSPALPAPLRAGAGAGRVWAAVQWVLRAGSGRVGTPGLSAGSWLCAQRGLCPGPPLVSPLTFLTPPTSDVVRKWSLVTAQSPRAGI